MLEVYLSLYKNSYKDSVTQGDSFLKNLKESDLSIDEKWELFVQFCKVNPLFDIRGSVITLSELEDNNLEYQDDFYLYKYQIVHFTVLIDHCNDLMNDGANIDINKLKEEIINLECTGFVYDW